MIRPRNWAAVGIAVALAGCGRGPEDVADRFVDAYFVQASQESALPLSSGLATQKLKDEVALLLSVRGGSPPPPDRPTIRVHRRDVKVSRDVASVRYDLSISSGSDVSEKRALLVVRQDSGQWRVSNWSLFEAAPDGRSPSRE